MHKSGAGGNSGKKKKPSFDTSKNHSISNMFSKKIEDCKETSKCKYCKFVIKKCLLLDHENTKCQAKMKSIQSEMRKKEDSDSDIIFVGELNKSQNESKKIKMCGIKPEKELKSEKIESNVTPIKPLSIVKESIFSIFENEEERVKYSPLKSQIVESTETKISNLANSSEENIAISFLADNDDLQIIENKLNEIQEPNVSTPKKRNFARKSTSACKYEQHVKENFIADIPDSISSSSNDDLIVKLNTNDENADEISNEFTKTSNFCYALNNFVNAIDDVLKNEHFIYLLNDDDLEVVKKFHQLSGNYILILNFY